MIHEPEQETMTEPMSEKRLAQLRELAEMSGPDSAVAHADAEIDRLRAELGEVRDKWHSMCLQFEEQFAQNARLHDLYDGAQRMIPGFQAENSRLRAELANRSHDLNRAGLDAVRAQEAIERVRRYTEGRMEGWAIDIRERLDGDQS
jgi:hypothetical protein